MGSNPTSDKIFFKVIQIHILMKTLSTEPDLNQLVIFLLFYFLLKTNSFCFKSKFKFKSRLLKIFRDRKMVKLFLYFSVSHDIKPHYFPIKVDL